MFGSGNTPVGPLFIDVGSTLIKAAFQLPEYSSRPEFYPRGYGSQPNEQIPQIINLQKQSHPEINSVRICSSANGGIKVGIISITHEYSGTLAKRAAMSGGANVLYTITLNSPGISNLPSVDLLIVAGGTEASATAHAGWLEKVFKYIKFDAQVIFSGPASLFCTAQQLWENCVYSSNVMSEDLAYRGNDLSNLVRDAYLMDLADHKGISELADISDTPIFSTPAVVHAAYDTVQTFSKYANLLPLVVIDIGGATTDIYFGADVVSDDCKLATGSSSFRHVFTQIGLNSSRQSTLRLLSEASRLSSFITAAGIIDIEERYFLIRAEECDWVTDELLALACFFLAFSELTTCEEWRGQLCLERVQGLVITGGAGQLINERSLRQLTPLFFNDFIQVDVDTDYTFWTLGLASANQ